MSVYIGSLFSVSISCLGALVLMSVFPIITADPELPWYINGVATGT